MTGKLVPERQLGLIADVAIDRRSMPWLKTVLQAFNELLRVLLIFRRSFSAEND
jgi:hypothetical protein